MGDITLTSTRCSMVLTRLSDSFPHLLGLWNHQVLNFTHPVCYVLSTILIEKSTSWQEGARSQMRRLSAVNVFSLCSLADCSVTPSAVTQSPAFAYAHREQTTIPFFPGFGPSHIVMNCGREARQADFQPVSPQHFISEIYNPFASSSHTSGCQVEDVCINWAWGPRRHALLLG